MVCCVGKKIDSLQRKEGVLVCAMDKVAMHASQHDQLTRLTYLCYTYLT